MLPEVRGPHRTRGEVQSNHYANSAENRTLLNSGRLQRLR